MIPPWNAVRFDRARAARGHVESYFLKLNDGASRRALWLKATILARRGQPAVAESWAIAFDRERGHRAAKQTVAFSSARFGGGEALDVHVAGLALGNATARGEVVNDATSVRFDLRYDGGEAPLAPLPLPAMYTGGFPRSKLVSPVPDTRFFGSYTVGAERIEVDGWRGMYGHNWGASHAHHYAWGHASGFDGEPDAFFEGVTARVKLGPLTLPPLTLLCLSFRGVRYSWNRPRDLLHNRAIMDTRRWEFSAENDLGSLRGDLAATTDEMVGLQYDNPVGDPCFCLNAKIASGRLRFTPRGRAPIDLYTRETALEIGTTDASHGVRVYV